MKGYYLYGMRLVKLLSLLLLSVIWLGAYAQSSPDIRIAFGSCNRSDKTQSYWTQIEKQHPHLWIWTGDIIYGDSPDSTVLASKYNIQKLAPEYKAFRQSTAVTGTWDDHDYGINDGGKEWHAKVMAKRQFINFIGFSDNHPIHQHKGIYNSYMISHVEGDVKVINLDTRSFRDTLTPSTIANRRYDINKTGDVLGEAQWEWLASELNDPEIDLFVISSSIQVIAEDHGWEKWANLPEARKRLFKLLEKAHPKAVVIISGDRHIAEYSVLSLAGLPYPLFDITSSGLTHTWSSSREEYNAHRKGELIVARNFGLLDVNFTENGVEVHSTINSAEDGSILAEETILFN